LAIYRGAGGAGDAVGDASSEVLLALQAKNAAIAAQAAAEAAQAAAQTAETNAELAETNAETAETNAETAETNAETAQAAAASSASAASTSATNAAASASTATTQATNAASSASSASTSASNASSSASSASTSASNATSAQTAAESARDATLAAYDSFDDRYLGAKSSAPTLDNDGNALVGGALYFDTVSQGMKVYTGSAWVDAYVPGSTYLAKANNLSDLTNTGTARTNLGVAIGTNVQAYDADLATIAGLTPTNNYAIIGNGTSWTSSALPASGVTSVTGTSPISSSGGATPAISLDNSGVTANTYGSSSSIPVITVSAKGLLTSVTTASVSGGAALSNDTSTASDLYPMFAAATSGTPTTVYTSNAKLLYKPSTGELKASQLVATNGIIANSATIAANYTIASGQNAMSTGAVTVNSGVTVTVSSGSRWVVL
jgi:hypothetical protein